MSRGGKFSLPSESIPLTSNKPDCRYKIVLLYILIVAAKLGRRSRKMKATIADACKSIEDTQTAQALHGLLSLKAENHGGVITFTPTTTSVDVSSFPAAQTSNVSLDMGDITFSSLAHSTSLPTTSQTDTLSASKVTSLSLPTASTSVATGSADDDDDDQQVGQENPTDSDVFKHMMDRLAQARVCNSEVFNVSC